MDKILVTIALVSMIAAVLLTVVLAVLPRRLEKRWFPVAKVGYAILVLLFLGSFFTSMLNMVWGWWETT